MNKKKQKISDSRAIYTKWIKEKLKYQYGIMPIATIQNPEKPHLNIWIYRRNQLLASALNEIMKGGKKEDGDKN